MLQFRRIMGSAMEKSGDSRLDIAPTLPWRHLFAEFIAIAAGIFLGLLADDYRDYRTARESEQDYLRLVVADLDRDHDILVWLRRAASIKSDGAQLINNTSDKDEIATDAIELAITEIVFTLSYEPQRTAYLGLRDSAQVQLIKSASVRSSLTYYFEVTQPDLLITTAEFNQYQQYVRRRVGRYVRLFPPERFDTLHLDLDDPDVSNITKLIVPVSEIHADAELMNDIVEVGARGFQLADLIKQAENQNRGMLAQLTKYLE